MSSFHGKPDEPKTPVAKPLRTYIYKLPWDADPVEVQAHYVKFEANHVCFWQDRPDNVQDTLVLAEENTNVGELKEVTP